MSWYCWLVFQLLPDLFYYIDTDKHKSINILTPQISSEHLKEEGEGQTEALSSHYFQSDLLIEDSAKYPWPGGLL